MKNCTICGKKIVLVPSASERAKKFGGTPSHYESLFTTHAACALEDRDEDPGDCPYCGSELKRGEALGVAWNCANEKCEHIFEILLDA